MPNDHTHDTLHSDLPEEPAPMPTSDAEAYAKGREDERKAIVEYLSQWDARWSGGDVDVLMRDVLEAVEAGDHTLAGVQKALDLTESHLRIAEATLARRDRKKGKR